MKWRSRALLLFAAAMFLAAVPRGATAKASQACAEAPEGATRHAFVLTNAAYRGEPPLSGRRRAMEATGRRAAQMFCGIGYATVTTESDLEGGPALEAIAQFVGDHRDASQIAVYIIGHGKQFAGVPHILGVDFDIDRPPTPDIGLSIHAVYNRLGPLLDQESRANLVIFVDACRDDNDALPSEANFVPSGAGGALYATRRIWVAYATQPGSLAEGSDGAGGEATTAFFRQWSAALSNDEVQAPEYNNWTYVVQLAGEQLAARGQQYPLVVGGWPGYAVARTSPAPVSVSPTRADWLPVKAGHHLLFDRPTKFLVWERSGPSLSMTDRKVNLGFDAAVGVTSGYPDHAAAERLWKEAAQSGSAVAAHNLGVLAYYYSDDWSSAKRWFDDAWTKSLAEFGSHRLVPTQTDLAYILAVGLGGMEIDQEQALAMFLRSAEAGDPDAMSWVAHLLDQRGRFVDAETWRLRAASSNEPSALYELALRSQSYDLGGDAQRVTALMENAALQGDRDVQALVGHWFISRGECASGLRHLNASARKGSRDAAIELRSLQAAQACLPPVG